MGAIIVEGDFDARCKKFNLNMDNTGVGFMMLESDSLFNITVTDTATFNYDTHPILAAMPPGSNALLFNADDVYIEGANIIINENGEHCNPFEELGELHIKGEFIYNAKHDYDVSDPGKHICTVCNQSWEHDFSKYISNENGTHKVICKECNVDQSGHDKDACSGGKASCKNKAVCEKCGKEYGDIDATTHIEEVKNKKDATCTEKGYTGDKCCKDCGIVLEVGKAIEALGHTWDAGKVTKEPTKDADGVKIFTCTRCGETKTEVIDKLTDDTKPTPSPDPVKPLNPEISVKGKYDVAAVVATMTDKKPLAYAITKGNKKAAKITKKGILTAKKADTLEITAYSDKKKKDVITTVTVVIKDTKVPTKDMISYMDNTCDIKSKITDLPAGVAVKFSISEKQQKIATVDAVTGIVTPVKNGKVKVLAEIGEGNNAAKFYTTITIKTPQINPSKSVLIAKDKEKTISLKNVKADDKIEWSVSDNTKAEIVPGTKDSKIKVKGLAAGKVTLTADVNGHKISKEIEITE